MASRAASRVLTDHEEIRQWVEDRGGRPAAVRRTASESDPGILRIDFPGYSGAQSLEEVEWDEFFEKFDENNLALLVQDETAGGARSNFNKIISRETAAQAGNGRGRSSGSRGGSRTSARSSRSSARGQKSSGRSSSRGRSTATKRTSARPSAGRRKAGANKKTSARASRKTSSRGSGRRRAA